MGVFITFERQTTNHDKYCSDSTQVDVFVIHVYWKCVYNVI